MLSQTSLLMLLFLSPTELDIIVFQLIELPITGTMFLLKMNKKYTNLKIFNTLLNHLETNEDTKSCKNFNKLSDDH